jgi:uroporphyrin-III C-methyltransferase
VVANGTTSEQQTVVAPLAEIADAARSLDSPALVVIGDVVALAGALAADEAAAAAAA